MEFQLIDVDLCESMLYRRSRRFNTLTGKDVANLLYLNTLMLYILSIEKPVEAEAYAHKSAQFGPYTLFRTNSTDLYLLGYATKYPDNDHMNLLNPVDSKRFLNRLLFDAHAHHRFIRRISGGTVSHTDASSYLYRLESQLRITDSQYKNWRRHIINWENASSSSRQHVTSRMSVELKRIGKGSAIASELLPLITSVSTPKKPQQEPRMVDTTIAAPTIKDVAQYWARSKL